MCTASTWMQVTTIQFYLPASSVPQWSSPVKSVPFATRIGKHSVSAWPCVLRFLSPWKWVSCNPNQRWRCSCILLIDDGTSFLASRRLAVRPCSWLARVLSVLARVASAMVDAPARCLTCKRTSTSLTRTRRASPLGIAVRTLTQA